MLLLITQFNFHIGHVTSNNSLFIAICTYLKDLETFSANEKFNLTEL